jgi:hypothetical protein
MRDHAADFVEREIDDGARITQDSSMLDEPRRRA